jgi:hypothetical protein
MPRTWPALTPEFQLLAACSWLAPAPLSSFQAGQIQQATARLTNWQAFLELVSRHRVAAPVATNLRRHAPRVMPDEWRLALAKQELRACEGALRHAGELARLGRVLSQNGIAVLPLKGALLSLRLFGDIGMRDVRDIDLLVQPVDLWRADQLLRDAGYVCTYPNFALTPHMRDAALRVAHHFTYAQNTTGLLVELHWRLNHWTADLMTQLWEQCGQRQWMGTQWKDLTTEQLLALLCDHGARHKWSSIKWLADISGLLARTPAEGWQSVLAVASQFDVERSLAQAALLSRWLFSIPLPPPLSELIARERAASRLAATAALSMLSANPHLIHSKNPLIRLPQLLLEFLLYNNKLHKKTSTASEINQLAVCLEDFRGAPIPDRLFFLYYLRRPFFWIYRRLTESPAR